VEPLPKRSASRASSFSFQAKPWLPFSARASSSLMAKKSALMIWAGCLGYLQGIFPLLRGRCQRLEHRNDGLSGISLTEACLGAKAESLKTKSFIKQKIKLLSIDTSGLAQGLFITRKVINHDIITSLDELLSNYFFEVST